MRSAGCRQVYLRCKRTDRTGKDDRSVLDFFHTQRRPGGRTTRRRMLQAGAGLFGLSLPRLLAAQEQAPQQLRARADSVLFLFLFGGPSQLETFDLKPQAASGIRGPYLPIASRTSGLLISEKLPRLAECSHRYSVLRAVAHPKNDHNACHDVQTGRPLPPGDRGGAGVDSLPYDDPAMGSVIEYLDQHSGLPRELPSYFYLPARLGNLQGYDRPGQDAGWLGRAYNALATNIRKRGAGDDPYFRDCTDDELDFRIGGLTLGRDVDLSRLQARSDLRSQLDAVRETLDGGALDLFTGYQRRALELVASPKLSAALDVVQEPAETRDRYGRHLFGQTALVGRRLIEAGARFVTAVWDAPNGLGWDSHVTNADVDRYLLPGLDQTLPTLLADMEQRGLLERTLVVCLGEMGRTPRGKDGWGRDHWSYCFPALFAGAGVTGGRVLGKSDGDAAFPVDFPVTPGDLAATIYWALGIPPETVLHDAQNRPHALASGRPLTELWDG